MISVLGAEKLSVVEIEAFLAASESVRFAGQLRAAIYGWVQRLRVQQGYVGQGRRAKGLLRAYVGKMTGLSRAQVTRLIGRYVKTGRVVAAPRSWRSTIRPQNSLLHWRPKRSRVCSLSITAQSVGAQRLRR